MIFNVGDVLPARHDLATVIASYVVAVLGSYTALFHAQHMFRANGSLQPANCRGGAAVSLGGIGIWTTHFTGMVAYRLPFAVMYEGILTQPRWWPRSSFRESLGLGEVEAHSIFAVG